MEKKKKLIVISGPTASGKTGLAVAVAKLFGTEVISCDSRQFYYDMKIGTAMPEEEELQGVPHHFLGFLPITEVYSAGQYERDAIAKLEFLFKTHEVAVLVGGSGLYEKAILEGLDDLPSDKEVRMELIALLANSGIEVLQNELRERDPVHFDTMDIQNHQRLIRALEVCRISNNPYSELRLKNSADRSFEIYKFAINYERENLYERINQRVDIMMNQGHLEEVKSLKQYQSLNALNTVGYKEIFKYLDGEWELNFAIDKMKQHTRNYAKKQLTWHRKDEKLVWLEPNNPDDLALVINKHIYG